MLIPWDRDRLYAQLIEDPIEKMGPTDAFAAERLTPASLDWLKETKPSIRLSDEIFLCHGTPDNDDRYLTEKVEGPKGHLPDEETLLEELKGETAPVVCCGHTHSTSHPASENRTDPAQSGQCRLTLL